MSDTRSSIGGRPLTDQDVRSMVSYVPITSVGMQWCASDAEAFDTWLAEVRRDAAVEALGFEADRLGDRPVGSDAGEWLRTRAMRVWDGEQP